MDSARTQIKRAIDKAGGVERVSDRTGIHFTSLYRMLKGADLCPSARSRLREALPRVPARVWADVWAPLPPSRAMEATQ
jgi:hypothetical protein